MFDGRERADEPWGEPLAAAREVAGALRARRDAARLAGGRAPSEPVFDFDSDGPRDRRAPRGADRVAPGDRGADGAGQRAGGRAPGRPPARPRSTGCTSGPTRSRSSSWSSSSPRSTCPPRRCPSSMSPQQAADLAAEASHLVADHVERTGRGRRGVRLAGPALAQAGLLHAAQPGPRRAGQPALLPLHLADPALPGHRGAPRAAGRASASTTSAPRGARARGGRDRELGPPSARR